MESNTKFGIALVVLLLGTLGFVVYKKMDKRQSDLAGAGATEDPGSASPNPPPQSEPSPDGEPRSAAYRPSPSSDAEFSRHGDGPAARSHVHPLRRLDEASQASPDVKQPNPFDDRRQAQSAATPAGQTEPAGSSMVTDPFHQPGETAAGTAEAQGNPGSRVADAGDSTDSSEDGFSHVADSQSAGGVEQRDPGGLGSSPFDASTATAQSDPAAEDQCDPADSPWTAAGQVPIQAGTTTSVHAAPSSTATTMPASHDAPWSQHRAGAATQAVGAPAPHTPPFRPVASGFDSIPRSGPPTPTASPAGASADSTATAAPHGARAPAGFDLSRFSATGQSFIAVDDRPAVYTVRAGDNYWAIARSQYGTPRYYQALAVYNSHRISDPQRMRPGMKVLVPDRRILEARFPGLLQQGSAGTAPAAGLFQGASGETMYRVGKNDTLGSIAQRHLGRSARWIEIYRLNQDRLTSPAALKIGLELRLPADASRVRVVSEAVERR
ncbi:MAG TPA: LysM peptidoglycan-binding domain-containing protein [Planctomycetaceae bacterium]|nr:LysM peptidoglycan-binding domain-containing protein [Planctomycetaceae bacterium]